MSEQAQKQYEALMTEGFANTEGKTLEPTGGWIPATAAEPKVEGVDYNIPLTSSQKFTITSIRLKRANVQKQIAELQTTDAKLEGLFHGELMRIAIENKIDMARCVLSDDLDIKPMGK